MYVITYRQCLACAFLAEQWAFFVQVLRKSNEMGLKKLLECEELQLNVERTSMESADF